MVDHIKFNKILPSMSPASKVVRTGARGRQNQGTPFKDSLERKQKKKKKENSDIRQQPDSEMSAIIMPPKQHADKENDEKCSLAGKSVRCRLIDIRV